MKRLTYFLSLLVALAMLLAACGPADEGAETPGVIEPGLEETEPGGVFTEEPTEPLVTEPVEPTEPLATETVETTEAVTETEVLPPTGFVDPGRVTNLLDFDVWSQDNEQIGSVSDIVLDVDETQIEYVIVDMGGFLGIGGKLVAVPYDRVEVRTRPDAPEAPMTTGTPEEGDSAGVEDLPENAVIVNATQEELEQAPEFDPGLLPELGEPATDWDVDIHGFWTGTEITTEGTETPAATEELVTTETPEATESVEQITVAELQGVVLASDLIGMDILGSEREEIATVEDIIVEPDSGNVQYLVISVSGIEDLEGNWILIPLEAFGLDADNQVLVLDVDQQILAGAPAFEDGQLPNTTEANWNADIQTYWQGELQVESDQ
ncbi:MAG TPA: PRC-barrel domain-containing protein [Anaerolineales bacterium]